MLLQMSKPSDEQAAMQHYLVCGTEDCHNNGQFYCNDCHRPLCEQCRDEHLKSPKTKIHEIVLYRRHKHQLPVQECELHPTRNVEIVCRECKTQLCSKCSTMKEHKGHNFDDLEEIYARKYALWQGEFAKIQKYFLPTSQNLKTDIEEDAKHIKKTMESIRISMKAEADSLKNLVDEVTSENIEHTHITEKALLETLKSQETIHENYIAYLGNMSDEFQKILLTINKKLLFSETMVIKTIPDTLESVIPAFTAGQFNKEDVAKLLGKSHVPDTELKKRKIQPMVTVSTDMPFPDRQSDQSREKSITKPSLFLSSSVTKVKEYRVRSVGSVFHASVDTLGRLWASDHKGKLVHTDQQGKRLLKIKNSNGPKGYHTVTQDGNLVCADTEKKVIYIISPDTKITEFIKTAAWKPICVHSSRINGDMLMGMSKYEAKVTRYNKAGKEIQNIQMDNKGHKLYGVPHYITENINGDICVSDFNKNAVVVVNKSGQHRFSYSGQRSEFCPYGICTDVLGHILVCDSVSNTVYLLDQDGGFLSVLLSPQQIKCSPRGVCVDDENNLYVGQRDNNTVTVYKYLQ